MKKLSTVMIMMALIMNMVMVPMTAEASDRGEAGMVADGSELLEESVDEAHGEYYARMRGVYLMSGSGTIKKVDSTTIAAHGSTTAHSKVDSITVYVYVEKFTGSKWTGVTSWGATDYNDYYVSTSRFVTVDKGYYYRVRTFHSAGGESTSGSTDGIKID